jgi:ATP-dependent Clp protease ATP-binding subunit ClpX
MGFHGAGTFCDFCGSQESQGREMVAGPGIYICDQCVELAVEVLEDRRRQAHAGQ